VSANLNEPTSSVSRRLPLLDSLLVLIVASLSIFPFLGFGEVYQVSEGREGVVVNAILDHGEYILPLRHNELVPSKPPLFHWLSAGAANLFGEYREFELRFVSACAGVLLTLFIAAAGERFFGRRGGLVSALIFLTTLGALRLSFDGRVDMLFGLLFSGAVLPWLTAYLAAVGRGEKARSIPVTSWRTAAIFSGLAILTKGPLGIVAPGIVMAGCILAQDGWRELSQLFRRSWLWTALICVPWYIAATFVGHAAFLSRQIFFENIQRFVGGEGITRKPFWFYLEQFWAYAVPWSIVLVFLCVPALIARLRGRTRPAEPRAPFPVHLASRFCGVWIVIILALLTASSGKRAAYLLLISPPMSLMIAAAFLHFGKAPDFFAEQWSSKRSTILRLGRVWLLCLIVLGMIPYLIWEFPALQRLFSFSGALQIELKGLADAFQDRPRAIFAATNLVLLFAALLWERGFRLSRMRPVFVSMMLATLCVVSIYANLAHAMKGKTHGYKDFAAQVGAAAPGDQPLTFIKRKREESFDGFFFYLRRDVLLFEPAIQSEETARPQTPGWYLARAGWIEEQPDRWTQRVEKVLIGGRRVDTPERKVVLFQLRPPEVQDETPTADAGNIALPTPSPTPFPVTSDADATYVNDDE